MIEFTAERERAIKARLHGMGYGGRFVAVNAEGRAVGSGNSRELAEDDVDPSRYGEGEYAVLKIPRLSAVG